MPVESTACRKRTPSFTLERLSIMSSSKTRRATGATYGNTQIDPFRNQTKEIHYRPYVCLFVVKSSNMYMHIYIYIYIYNDDNKSCAWSRAEVTAKKGAKSSGPIFHQRESKRVGNTGMYLPSKVSSPLWTRAGAYMCTYTVDKKYVYAKSWRSSTSPSPLWPMAGAYTGTSSSRSQKQ